MSSPAIAPIAAEAPVAHLDFYLTRDEFVRAYQPATPEELLLVAQITRAWIHLQQVYDLRSQLTERYGLLALFENEFEKYKALARNLTDAERMWRHSILELERARRRRSQPPSASRRNGLSAVSSLRPEPPPASCIQPTPSARPTSSAKMEGPAVKIPDCPAAAVTAAPPGPPISPAGSA